MKDVRIRDAGPQPAALNVMRCGTDVYAGFRQLYNRDSEGRPSGPFGARKDPRPLFFQLTSVLQVLTAGEFDKRGQARGEAILD